MSDVLPVKNHEFFMQQAIALAKKAKGLTYPNPMVGAIIIDENKEIIGRGYHPKAGEAHAEVFAIREALQKKSGFLSDCILYVTLEPCNHTGRTPPCVNLVIDSRLKSVVVGVLDPNPLMQGQSIEALKTKGVDVITGVCAVECQQLIRGFKKVMEENRPFVSLKAAASLDGKLATGSGESKWITGSDARAYAHELRADHDAVLVGVGTILKDDPSLNARIENNGNLLTGKKIILDSRLRTPVTAKIFNSPGQVLIYCDKDFPGIQKEALEKRGAKIIPLWRSEKNPGTLNLHEVVADLALHQGVQDLLVEGGSQILGSFLKENIFDQLYYFVAPKIIGGEGRDAFAGFDIESLKDSEMFSNLKVKQLGKDFVFEGARACLPV